MRCIRPLCHLSKEAKSGVLTPRSGRVLGEDGRPDKAGAEEFRTGKPLLLLHGWPEVWLTWVMARLADRFMLLALDLRGFGGSDKPDGPSAPTSTPPTCWR